MFEIFELSFPNYVISVYVISVYVLVFLLLSVISNVELLKLGESVGTVWNFFERFVRVNYVSFYVHK